jgi:hypothetical protein
MAYNVYFPQSLPYNPIAFISALSSPHPSSIGVGRRSVSLSQGFKKTLNGTKVKALFGKSNTGQKKICKK